MFLFIIETFGNNIIILLFILFLYTSVRNFDALSVLPPASAALHENIHKRVFMTYLRMSTHKESKVHIIKRLFSKRRDYNRVSSINDILIFLLVMSHMDNS